MPLPTAAALVPLLAEHVEWDQADAHLTSAAAEAVSLVTGKVTAAGRAPDRAEAIPADIGIRACLEVGADLFYRRTARHGIAGLNGADGMPMRIQRDPLAAALPILAPWLGWGIG